MSRANLLTRYQGSLLDSSEAFTPEDLGRHLDLAVADFNRFCPLVIPAELTVQAGVAQYPCPDDLDRVLACDWGRDHKADSQPWDYTWPGRLPAMTVVRGPSGRRLHLSPAPSAGQIATLGAACTYRYTASHVLTDNANTLTLADEVVVLLRAQAEAMRELAIKNVSRPVQLRDGMSHGPKNGTPAYLYAALMSEFSSKVAA